MTSYTIFIAASDRPDPPPINLTDGDVLEVTMPPPDDPQAVRHYEAFMAERKKSARLTGELHRALTEVIDLEDRLSGCLLALTRAQR